MHTIRKIDRVQNNPNIAGDWIQCDIYFDNG